MFVERINQELNSLLNSKICANTDEKPNTRSKNFGLFWRLQHLETAILEIIPGQKEKIDFVNGIINKMLYFYF